MTIADLDGGYDPEHADLEGVVVEARDFTGTGIRDGYGHGTHTASTIAGSGAASAGKYKGVAPDAKLLVGKVCEDGGGCPESAIIAGMEWAAASGAAAVNMSLGGGPTDGTDPMSQAVNALTASTGTLFVIAAGNSGAPGTVGAPGAADAALTVGSVTKQDALSAFSSRGPRVGDQAIKPDIAAPGSAIVAARAAGTSMGSPVDAFYTSANGTSMATPHVTGAAAILKQQHPDWKADQLKSALMGAANPLTGLSVYEQGAGRLDVARAIGQQVRTTPASLSLGFYKWPRTGGATKTLTYHNDGDAPVVFDLALHTRAGLFSLSVKQVTVPARGSASVDVTVHPSSTVPGGHYGGALTATSGQTVLRTPVGASLEEESYSLEVNAIGRGGAVPWFSSVQVINTETGVSAAYFFADPENSTVRVPKGRYDIHSITYDYAGPRTLLSQPDTVIGGDSKVTLDARTAVPLKATVDRETAVTRTFLLSLRSGNATKDTGVGVISSVRSDTFTSPTKPVTGRLFRFIYQPVLVDPANHDTYNLMFYRDGAIPDPGGFRVRDRDLAVVDATYQSQGGAPAKGVRGGYGYIRGVAANVTVLLDIPVPLTRKEFYTPGPDITWDSMFGLRGTTGATNEYQVSPPKAYERRAYTVKWNRAPLGPSLGSYNDGWGLSREGDTISASIPLFSTAGDWAHTTSWNSYSKASTTLSRDGKDLGGSPYPAWGVVNVPADAGVYTLKTTSDRVAPWSIFGTAAEATWTFRSPGTTVKRTALPLFVVRASGKLDASGVAPSGRPFVLDLKVQRQQGAKYGRVSAPKLEVSYDDGVTWQRAPVFGSHALLCHPAGKAFVSLRSRVSDSLGNSVTHTVLRAYQVAPR